MTIVMWCFLTVRNVSRGLAVALERVHRRRCHSLNQTVIELLQQSLDVSGHRRSNGPSRFAGTWTHFEPTASGSFITQGASLDPAGAALVPAGPNGVISAYAFHPTDLILDINGYFAP
jgi:hypothetical protein